MKYLSLYNFNSPINVLLMKICVVGTGYVGMSLSVILARKFRVYALDLSKEKVEQINKKISPINEPALQKYLETKNLDLEATTDINLAYENCDFVVIATPTNFDERTGSFDTTSVENVISDILSISPNSNIVIKSTVPLGFTESMKNKFNYENIFFSPEFLRESHALNDNLYPSRIVIGDETQKAIDFGEMLIQCSERDIKDVNFIKMKSIEAEAVKLFSNTYLAMRVAFFNELDTFAEAQTLSAKKIIDGVSSDIRIGNYYNNPSFGYGGYCLPKDTKQLMDNFKDIPNNLISAVVEANKTRKNFIINSILERKPNIVGVYRLVMKQGSDNFRESAILDILDGLKRFKIDLILFEPFINDSKFNNIEVVNNLNEFISKSDLIIANRRSSDLDHVIDKVYSRDLFQEN